MWRFGRRKERGWAVKGGEREDIAAMDGGWWCRGLTSSNCAQAPGVYRVSRFLRGDHSRQAAEVCVHTTGGWSTPTCRKNWPLLLCDRTGKHRVRLFVF